MSSLEFSILKSALLAIPLKLGLLVVLILLVGGILVLKRRGRESHVRAVRDANRNAGMTEPPSLHPIIATARCIGCGACTKVCPEGNILGLIDNKAELIEPTSCIGHGACKTACPVDAISLVFGTASRGVDIPHVSPSFETNVPGVFIAGELGGMGLIANAIEQGRQAMASIAKLDGMGRRDIYRFDVIIIGAGPAGLSASLAAHEAGLDFWTLEQEKFGGTVAHFPRGKLIMTRPATLPMVGTFKHREIRKEKLLHFWHDIAVKYDLKVTDELRVDSIRPHGAGFSVQTARGDLTARAVLLATGRGGTPRKLNVPGEEDPKVVYRLTEPDQYRGQHVLVVGGGDSALEAAAELAEQGYANVTLSYRGAAFQRAKPRNRARVDSAIQAGRLTLHMNSQVRAIEPHYVWIAINGRDYRLPNHAVIVCAGGVPPRAFLEDMGIAVETKHGEVDERHAAA